ncbi:MAG: hypothetical protein AAB965_01510, partial [Patescibacteria group bacterium]
GDFCFLGRVGGFEIHIQRHHPHAATTAGHGCPAIAYHGSYEWAYKLACLKSPSKFELFAPLV